MTAVTTIHPAASASAGPLKWIGIAALASLVLSVTMLRHGYEGIHHDAQIYSFQAMAHLKPALLGNDLFLRFGSQDNYTVFSPIYAAAIGHLGLEPAAALITALSQLAFLFAAWLLARQVAFPDLAWLSVALLVAIPDVYGAYRIWNFFEGFVTPRLLCEAFVLAAIAASLGKQWWLSVACLIAGALLHPLMALGGAVLVICMQLVPFRPRALALLLSFGVAAAAAAVFIAWTFPSLQLGADALALVQSRQAFLFPTLWHTADWARAGVHLTMLLTGILLLPPDSRGYQLCMGAVIVGLGGIFMSWLGGDVLNLALIIQGQPWRWMWLAAVFSALLAPVIAARCWELGFTGRLALGLVVVAWLAIDEPYTIIVAPLALAAAAAAKFGQAPPARTQRLLLMGLGALFVIVLIRSVANAALYAKILPEPTPVPELVRWMRAYLRDGLIPCAVVIGMWWFLTRARAPAVRTSAAGACIIGCLAFVPVSATEWTAQKYPQSDFDAFASWRALIPPGEEVFWPDGSVETYTLLERPRYITAHQMASVLFSPRARVVLRQRALRLAPLAEKKSYLFWDEDLPLVKKGLVVTRDVLCASIDARFIVSSEDLDATPITTAPAGASRIYRGVKLYKCGN